MGGLVMVYDDEPIIVRRLPVLLENQGIPAIGFDRFDDAMDYIVSDAPPPAVLIADKSFARNDIFDNLSSQLRDRLRLEAGSFGSTGGFALLKAAKSKDAATRTILWSGETRVEPVARALGLWGYMYKPADLDVLRPHSIIT